MHWKSINRIIRAEMPLTIERKFALCPIRTVDGYTVFLDFIYLRCTWDRPYPASNPELWRKQDIKKFFHLENAENFQ